MRTFLLLLALILFFIAGFFFAQKMGWLGPQQGAESTVTPVEQVEEEEADVGYTPPKFDIVRVDRAGNATIAGIAAPDSEVTVIANGEPLASTITEFDGNWLIYEDAQLDAGPVEL